VVNVSKQHDELKKVGSVMVVGAGIGGMQAALDLANAGFHVTLVEETTAIGGRMAQLDKTFPTNDCSMCIISPKLIEVDKHLNIDVLTNTMVEGISGEPGSFKVKVMRRARYIDVDKCTGCGHCVQGCPVRNTIAVPDLRPKEPFLEPDVKAWVDGVLARYDGQARGALLPILQQINREFRYLPREVIEYLAARLAIPLSAVLRVATFYNVFSLKPRGRHTISVCLGTACFVKGSGMLLEKLKRELAIEEGETTSDRRFTLEAVRCIGCCALAPALRIDGDTYGHVRQNRVGSILKRYD
jgi:NADH:ubiquinone oxidoreductase subunit E